MNRSSYRPGQKQRVARAATLCPGLGSQSPPGPSPYPLLLLSSVAARWGAGAAGKLDSRRAWRADRRVAPPLGAVLQGRTQRQAAAQRGERVEEAEEGGEGGREERGGGGGGGGPDRQQEEPARQQHSWLAGIPPPAPPARNHVRPLFRGPHTTKGTAPDS